MQDQCHRTEDIGGKMMYRPEDFGRFLEAVGISQPVKAAPVMAEEFQLDFETEDAAREAETKLRTLRYAGEPARRVDRRANNIFGRCSVSEQLEPDAVL